MSCQVSYVEHLLMLSTVQLLKKLSAATLQSDQIHGRLLVEYGRQLRFMLACVQMNRRAQQHRISAASMTCILGLEGSMSRMHAHAFAV